MSIAAFKTVAFVAVFLTGLAGGIVSIRLAAAAGARRWFSWGNAFSGGVFLGAGLIHVLPDSFDGFASIPEIPDFPWAGLICGCGFLLVLFIEKIAVRSHHAAAESADAGEGASLTPYVLTLVLSIHSIIAGVALGAEETVVKALAILLAVVAHKGSAAFALGVSLNRGRVPRARVLKIIVLFCLMTPIGIVLGSLLRSALTGAADQAFESVFDALAAGTFLYVAGLEVIEEEFKDTHGRWSKFILVIAGLGFMALLALWL